MPNPAINATVIDGRIRPGRGARSGALSLSLSVASDIRVELKECLSPAQSVVGSAHHGGGRDMIEKVVSGGQTGVDRAALDAAIEAGIGCGGWCPRGRRAEDGVIPERYPLKQTSGSGYVERTRRNVEDSDGTLIVASGELIGGTLATLGHARRIGKPSLVVDPHPSVGEARLEGITEWLADHRIRVLNVAGPRESGHPGIYDVARELMAGVLESASIRRQS